MLSRDVKNEKEALAFLLDCTLATVETMAMKKSRLKGEFDRQKGIAEKAMGWCVQFNVDISTTRAHDICVRYKGDIDRWAERLMPDNNQ